MNQQLHNLRIKTAHWRKECDKLNRRHNSIVTQLDEARKTYGELHFRLMAIEKAQKLRKDAPRHKHTYYEGGVVND